MTTYTVYPSSLLSKSYTSTDPNTYPRLSTNSGSTWASTTVTDAQLLSAMNDNNDVTRVRNNGSNYAVIRCGLPTAAVNDATEFAARVSAVVRVAPWGQSNRFGIEVYRASGTAKDPVIWFTDGSSGNQEKTRTWYWSGGVSGLALAVAFEGMPTPSDGVQLLGCHLVVDTIALDQVTLSPTSQTVTDAPQIPVQLTTVIGWESKTKDPDSTSHKIEVQIETGGGSIPGSGTLKGTYSTTVTVATSGTSTVTATCRRLPNGSYDVYARSTRTFAGHEHPGAWVKSTLTLNVVRPTPPIVTVGAPDAHGVVPITLTAPASAGYSSPRVAVFRDDAVEPSGTYYVPPGNLPVSFGVPATVDDQLTPRGDAPTYVAYVLATGSGGWVFSDYTYCAGPAIPIVGWNLKDRDDFEQSLYGVTVMGPITEAVTADEGVFRMLDRAETVVVTGQISGFDGELKIRTDTAASWTATKTLLMSGNRVKLESAFGQDRYIRFLASTLKVSTAGTLTAPIREITCSYVQIG